MWKKKKGLNNPPPGIELAEFKADFFFPLTPEKCVTIFFQINMRASAGDTLTELTEQHKRYSNRNRNKMKRRIVTALDSITKILSWLVL